MPKVATIFFGSYPSLCPLRAAVPIDGNEGAVGSVHVTSPAFVGLFRFRFSRHVCVLSILWIAFFFLRACCLLLQLLKVLLLALLLLLRKRVVPFRLQVAIVERQWFDEGLI